MVTQGEISDLEAEALVVGALLEAGDDDDGRVLVGSVLAEVDDDDFTSRLMRQVVQAARALARKGEPVNHATVRRAVADKRGADLTSSEQAALVGAQHDIIGNIASGPHMARRVAALSERRTLQAVAREVAQNAGKRLDDAAYTAELRGMLLRTQGRSSGALRLIRWDDWMRNTWRAVDEAAQSDAPPGVQTGFEIYDRIGGLDRWEMHVVAGRPGAGKTAFVLALAYGAGCAGHNVLIVSLEMREVPLGKRIMAGISGVYGDRVRDPRSMEEADFVRISKALSAKSPNITLAVTNEQSSAPATVGVIQDLVRREHAIRPVDLVVVDYLQLVPAEVRGDRRTDAVASVSMGLTQIAKHTGSAVLALAQMNREIEKRNDPRPVMSDLADSAQIEKDAASVEFLSQYEMTEHDGVVAHEDQRLLYVAKGRHKAPGSIERLRFLGDRGPWFRDWTNEDNWHRGAA